MSARRPRLKRIGEVLGLAGHLSEEAIAVYDDLLARFGTANELPLRKPIVGALVNKGAALNALGRREEAIAVYDDLLARFGTISELSLLEEAASALVNKGAALNALGRREEAIAVYDDLLARFGTTELPLRKAVAAALINKGHAIEPIELLLAHRHHRHRAPPRPLEPRAVSRQLCRGVSSLYCSYTALSRNRPLWKIQNRKD